MKQEIKLVRVQDDPQISVPRSGASAVGRSTAVFELDASFDFTVGTTPGEEVGLSWYGADDQGSPVWDWEILNTSPTTFDLNPGSHLYIPDGIYMATMQFVLTADSPTVGSLTTFDPWLSWRVGTALFYRDDLDPDLEWTDYHDMYDTGLAVWTDTSWEFTVSQLVVSGEGGQEVLGQLWVTQLADVTQNVNIQATVKLTRLSDFEPVPYVWPDYDGRLGFSPSDGYIDVDHAYVSVIGIEDGWVQGSEITGVGMFQYNIPTFTTQLIVNLNGTTVASLVNIGPGSDWEASYKEPGYYPGFRIQKVFDTPIPISPGDEIVMYVWSPDAASSELSGTFYVDFGDDNHVGYDPVDSSGGYTNTSWDTSDVPPDLP